MMSKMALLARENDLELSLRFVEFARDKSQGNGING